MKKLVLFLTLLLVVAASFAQTKGYLMYDTLYLQRNNGNSELVLLNSTRDSLGFLFNKGNGRTEFRKVQALTDGSYLMGVDTLKVIKNQYAYKQPANAWIDTLKASRLKGNGVEVETIDTNTNYVYLRSGARTAQGQYGYYSPQFVISNVPKDSILNINTEWGYWRPRGGNALLNLERLFWEANNDTAAQQYNGLLTARHRYTMDKNSSRFDSATGKVFVPQNNGVYIVDQLFPNKNIRMTVGPFGNDGSAYTGVIGIGSDSSFKVTMLPASTSGTPIPWSVYRSEIDFDRSVVGQQRIIRGGLGMALYNASWKNYQGGGLIGRGSYVGRVTDYYSGGSLYTYPGGTPAKTTMLAESAVDTAMGFYSNQKYTDFNEVVNGYGFVQDGAKDINSFQGKTFIGFPWLKTKAGADSANNALWVYGDSKFTGAITLDSTGTIEFRPKHINNNYRINLRDFLDSNSNGNNVGGGIRMYRNWQDLKTIGTGEPISDFREYYTLSPGRSATIGTCVDCPNNTNIHSYKQYTLGTGAALSTGTDGISGIYARTEVHTNSGVATAKNSILQGYKGFLELYGNIDTLGTFYQFLDQGITSGPTGKINNYYGFYSGGINSSNIINAWGFYQADANAKNYFAGQTKFGSLINLPTSAAPTSSADATGTEGDIKRDAAGNLYLRTATQWVKFTGVTF